MSRRKPHPDQMAFDFPEPARKELPPRVRILEWLSRPVPLVHVGGENPHVCVVTTFEKGSFPAWVERDWIVPELERHGYVMTHTLTTPDPKESDVKYFVYRPWRQKGAIRDKAQVYRVKAVPK